MKRRVLFAAGIAVLCSAALPVRADEEEDAAAAVQKVGGLITRDEKAPGKPVVEVSFQGTSTGQVIQDKDLATLKGLKHLKTLHLGYVTKTTDAGLVHLKGLTSLEKLNLPETDITDAGLANLTWLKNLKSLGLVFCKGITDKSVPYLIQLKNLEYLNVASTKITPKGIAQIQKALPKVYITH